MKILLTAPHKGIYTGSGVQLGQLAPELVKRGHEVAALFKSPDDPNAGLDPTLARLVNAGIRVDTYRFRKLKHFDTFGELLRLRKFLKTERFDVVHCFKGTDFDFVTLASIGVPIPALFITRGNGMPLDIFNSFKYRRKKVKYVITVCEEVKNLIVKSGGINPDKIKVIYSSVDLTKFDLSIDGGAVRDELKISRNVPVVGIIGSIDFRPGKAKGGYEFAQAARLVLDKRPETIFLCVGQVQKQFFKPLGEELKMTDNFVFAGFRTDVQRMLAAMNASVCSSIRGEGLMGTLRESLAMGVPVVSTDVGGNKELVLDGRTGYIVPIKDPAAMASAILKLVNNPEESKKMGREGRKLVEELCDFNKQADKIESLYKTAVGK